MSTCYCDYDNVRVDLYVKKIVRSARRPHKCYECGSEIKAGEPYEKVFAIWDGEPENVTTCETCHDLRQWVQNSVPCFCWAHGSMLEDADAAVDDALFRAPEETKGLRFGYLRRKWAITQRRRSTRPSTPAAS